MKKTNYLLKDLMSSPQFFFDQQTSIGEKGPSLGAISSDKSAIIGRDGFLFLYEGTNFYFKQYNNVNGSHIGGMWAKYCLEWKTKLQNRGIEFHVLCVPNKATCLPEYYPFILNPNITPALSVFEENSNGEVLTFYNQIRSDINKNCYFRKFDTHLTEYGNLQFVSILMKRLRLTCPEHLVDNVKLFTIKDSGDLGENFLVNSAENVSRIRYPDYYDISEKIIQPSINSHTGLIYESYCKVAPIKRRLLIFGNSFIDRIDGWGMAPHLCRLFESVRFQWESGVYDTYIQEFRPDIVIFQTCERFLTELPRELPFAAQYKPKPPVNNKLFVMPKFRDQLENMKNFEIVINEQLEGWASINFNKIGFLKIGESFPLHELVRNRDHLAQYGVAIQDMSGLEASNIDFDDFIKEYLAGQNSLLDLMQSNVGIGKWYLYSFMPSPTGYITVTFGIVMPLFASDAQFKIECDGIAPCTQTIYLDLGLEKSHWFMPSRCLIGVCCTYRLAELPPYLGFQILFESNEIQIKCGSAFRKQICHTSPSMLSKLPELNRIRRVSGKLANEAMHLNSGRSAYNALKEIALKESVKLDSSHTKILDWGCGCGRVASHFVDEHDALLVGIDIDEDNISWCRENLHGKFTQVGLSPPTGIPANTFDMIYSCSVLSHLSSRQIGAWLEEIALLLSDSGVALLSFNGTSNATHYLSKRPLELRQIYDEFLFDPDLNDDLDGYISDESYYRATFASDSFWIKAFQEHFVLTRIEYSVVSDHQHIAVLRKKLM